MRERRLGSLVANVDRVAVRGSSMGSGSVVGRLKSDMDGPWRLNKDLRVGKRWRVDATTGETSRSR